MDIFELRSAILGVVRAAVEKYRDKQTFLQQELLAEDLTVLLADRVEKLEQQLLAGEERERALEAERDRAWDRVIRERDRKTAVAVAYSGTEIELRARIAALEAENVSLRDRVAVLGKVADSVAESMGGHAAVEPEPVVAGPVDPDLLQALKDGMKAFGQVAYRPPRERRRGR